MKIPSFWRTVVFLSMALLLANRAEAETIYNSFGGDGGYQSTSGFFVNTQFDSQFTVPFTGNFFLDTITIAAVATPQGDADPADVYVALRANTEANEPGVVLESIERNDVSSNAPTYASGTYTFTSLSNPLLQANSKYWIEVGWLSGGRPFWFANNVDAHDPVVEWQGSWTHYPATVFSPTFSVDVTPVPEPSSIVLSALGFLGIAALRRRLR